MSRAAALIALALHFLLTYGQQQSFSHTMQSTAGDTVTVDFNLFPIRSPNFGVLFQKDDGKFTPQSPPGPRTYLGTVRGYPGAMASGLRKANGTVLCRISFEDGVEWSSTGGLGSIRGSTDWKPKVTAAVVPPTTANSTMFVAEVGVDATYQEYLTTGSNLNDTIDMIEFSVMATNVPYIRDVSILHMIGKVVVRTSEPKDPYAGSGNSSVVLTTVRSQWTDVISGIVGKTHNLAFVVQAGTRNDLAYVGTAGTTYGYCAVGTDPNGDFSISWRHGAGHNWGSNNNEAGGPEGPTIMADNQLSRFSSSEVAKILSYKNNVRSLSSSMSIPRPPRANLDAVTLSCKQPFIIDVLVNDLDANVKGLKLVSVQSTSAMDSTLKITTGGILYTPSPTAPLSVDYFSYKIQNVDGRTSTGYVTVRPEDLVAWWKMEEKTGAIAQDSSGNAEGSITGSTVWDQGLVFGGSGRVSFGTKPSINGTTSFSISVWVKVPLDFTSTGVIIQQKSTSPNATNVGYQLFVSNGNPVFLLVGDDGLQFFFMGSTSIKDGQWHHLVVMRDYREGRLYVDGKFSGSSRSEVKNLDGNIPVFIGWDARDGVAFFTGTLMAARIYKRSLCLEEVQFLGIRPEALVGWWKMDEGSGLVVLDSSGNFGNGNITGSTTWDRSGGLSFTGAGKITIGTKPSLTGKTSFSIHATVKVLSNSTSPGVIIQQRSPPTSSSDGFNGEYQLSVSNGMPSFMLFGDGGYQFDFSASALVNDGQWHNIVAVRDQKEGRIYVDGKLSGSASGETRNLNGNISVFIGWDGRDSVAFFTGSLKDVKIYNQVVNPVSQNNILVAEA